jgi:hypothetical protein
VISRIKGATEKNREVLAPTEFEMGRFEVSPDSESIAWWWAQEQVHETPVSATVIENLEVFRVNGALEKATGRSL